LIAFVVTTDYYFESIGIYPKSKFVSILN